MKIKNRKKKRGRIKTSLQLSQMAWKEAEETGEPYAKIFERLLLEEIEKGKQILGVEDA